MNADSKSKVDLLNRKGFADEIAKGVVESAKKDSDGFVIGLTGKWGSGKSTLLDFIKDEIIRLSNENIIGYEIIDFNPWMFTDSDNIKKSFLKEIAAKLSNSFYSKAKRKSISVLKNFSGTTKKVGGEIGKDISELLQKYLENDTSINLKESIDKALLTSNKKLFIFIDDIDRLLPKQIFEILQVMKLSGNFKNTYYIVAFDREAVEISIESQFKDYGRKYLDKIIQADFLIPEVPKEKIEEIFFDMLKGTLESFGIQYNTRSLMSVWSYQGFRNYFTSLRDIYRYFNSLKFRLSAITNNINTTDFLIIEAIRLYDFIAYEKIYRDYSLILMSLKSNTLMSTEASLNNYLQQNTKLLVKYLFSDNPAKLAFPNSNEKRLYNRNYFDRYFTLKINSEDIGESDLRIIIEMNSDRKIRLENLLADGRLKNLLLRLNDSKLIEHYPDWHFSLIRDLFEFFDDNTNKIGDMHIEISNSIMNLLVINEKKKIEFLETFFWLLLTDYKKISNARNYFNHFIVLSEERNTGFADEYYYFKEFYKEKIETIKIFFFNYLEEWQAHYLHDNFPKEYPYYTLLFMYDFAKYKKAQYEEYANNLLNKKENVLFFLDRVVTINTLDKKPFRIDAEIISQLLPEKSLEKFIKELKNINIDFIDEEHLINRDFFLENYNRAKINH